MLISNSLFVGAMDSSSKLLRTQTILLIVVVVLVSVVWIQWKLTPHAFIRPSQRVHLKDDAEYYLKTGDLLLFRANNASNLRLVITGSNFTHVGMVWQEEDELYALDRRWYPKMAVCKTKLSELLQEYSGVIAVRRLNYTIPLKLQAKLNQFVIASQGPENDSISQWIPKLTSDCFLESSNLSLNHEVRFCTDFIMQALMTMEVVEVAPRCTKPLFFQCNSSSEYQINNCTKYPYVYENQQFELLP
jgi:hypothetical protein